MNILFVHQNFPGQYKHLAPALAEDTRNTVVAFCDQKNLHRAKTHENVTVVAYKTPNGSSKQTHHYIRSFEAHVRRGQAVARAGLRMREKGFVPDVVCVHPGWGEGLYLRDVWPEAKLLHFCEFYYNAKGSDIGFDPEFPSSVDDSFRIRTKNATQLLSLQTADWCVSPTRWQASQYPAMLQQQMSIVHDGVDTQRVRPDRTAQLTFRREGKTLRAGDEVITYVARNLEPYRGFHIFMRALPEILRRRPNAEVVIVGGDRVSYGSPLPDGDTYRQRMLREVGEQLDMSRVHFLGNVPYEHYLKLLQISGVHVYLTYPFVLSWSLLEAMAAECLVVGSDTAPLREVVRDGHNGLLVDFFSTQAIAQAVDRVLDDPARMQDIRARARQTVVDGYDLRGVCLPRHMRMVYDLGASKTPDRERHPKTAAGPALTEPRHRKRKHRGQKQKRRKANTF
jgi:glycosyltransferase involved in cell wall biosynthesis